MRLINRYSRHSGFSLLEMMVAMSILAIALVSLYQAASSATRNVRLDEKYAYAVVLGESLLALNAQVPLVGVNERGETSGEFRWRVESRPIELGRGRLSPGSLHAIEVAVGWKDGQKNREIVLNSVVEGIRP